MKNKCIKNIIAVVLLAAITAAAVAPIQSAKKVAGNWMARLDDGQSISELSIPGTHDSGALYSFSDIFGKCQTLSVAQQLEIGVRFFDLRLQLVDNELQVMHNFVEQKTEFNDLIEDIAAFLRENPSEFLLISFKEEADPVRSTVSFEQKLESALMEYSDIISTAQELPNDVGSARGKIHIISRYEGSSIGLPCAEGWENNTSFVLGDMYVQDYYKINHTDEKIAEINIAIDAAASGEYDLVLNYTSCYFKKGFPTVYAGVPARLINSWLEGKLSETDSMVGVLVCDFITSDIAEQIIERNFI